MCDNIVAVGSATADGSVIFAKNSDREPNEPQAVLFIPRAKHPAGSVVHCTYIDVPQVEETYALLLSKPSWLWGGEMGANEHGLVIGNTAVFTRMEYQTGPGLVGMDFLRLALERTPNAPAALALITTLLTEYGQSGNNGFSHELFYHNSFLICDPREAWVLETSGRQWAAKRVRDIGATSNTLTIDTDWDLASDGLVPYAVAKGWCKHEADFNFKEHYGGPGFYASYLYTFFGRGDQRYRRLTSLLAQQPGRITVEVMMQALRDHGENAGPDYSPDKGLVEGPPCMHAGPGPVRVSQTTGSLVSHLTPDRQTHWVTATAAPCTSIFKPVWLDSGLPDLGPIPTGRYSHAALWWRHEGLHREVLRDYATRLAAYRSERDELEAKFLAKAEALQHKPTAERAAFSARCFEEADRATSRWTVRVRAVPIENRPAYLYRRALDRLNKESLFTAADQGGVVLSPAGK
jgi:dipeptidase